MKMPLKKTLAFAAAALIAVSDFSMAFASDSRPAKQVFGTIASGSSQTPEAIGFYSKGCQSGAVQMPYDGPTWQVMRLSRNRRWGQPQLIGLLEQLSRDAAQKDGWSGLLVGDIAQPRGGPMITGHASHQIGLDADIWLTPMPGRRLTAAERENLSAISMLQKNARLTVDPKIWTPAHGRVIMRAAGYSQVERIFVNPAIKKKLCETWTGDRNVLGKVRPYYGHDYHFHIRMNCPVGDPTCKPQAPPPPGDGCGKELAWWFSDAPWRKPKPPEPNKPAPKPRIVTVGDLPNACQAVLAAGPEASDDNMGVKFAARSSAAAEDGVPVTSVAAAAPAAMSAPAAAPPVATSMGEGSIVLPAIVPLPLQRPVR
jgi:penicillin-insensitive murein DD-endopeptidase